MASYGVNPRLAFTASERPEAQEALTRLVQMYGRVEEENAQVIVALGGAVGCAFIAGQAAIVRSTGVLLMGLAVLLVVWETVMAKMRLFRVPQFLGFALMLGLLAMLTHVVLET